MVNWEAVKWRKMREEIDREAAYAGMTATRKLDLVEESKAYLEGYRSALRYVKMQLEKIDKEYDGTKKSQPKTVDLKIGLTDDDIKECFIKAMEEMLEELKQK